MKVSLKDTDRLPIVQPVICSEINSSLKENIFRRDDGKCCISKASDDKRYKEDPLIIHILSPTLFHDSDMAKGVGSS